MLQSNGARNLKTRISILVPTRQRPERLKAYYDSAMELANNPEQVEFVAYIDDDDHSYDGLELSRLFKVLGPRVVLSEAWNRCWEFAEGEIYHHGGDDNLFRTKGWDTIVLQTFERHPDRILFAYGDDGNEQSRLNKFGTHGFVHKNWTDVTGKFVPPYFVSDYNDTWFNDVSKAIGRHVHMEILIEHMHYTLGKSEIDQNTRDRLARHEKERPQDLYYSQALKDEREAEANKLKRSIEEHSTVKWSILVATLGQREERFKRLLSVLAPQVEKYGGQIEILAYWNNFDRPLPEIRQSLVEEARGQYVSFIDDDDLVPSYFCDEVMERLGTVDYIGWQMQAYTNGEKLKPTFHSLKYEKWFDDDKGYYRNTSHLNPIKREIALKESFIVPQGVAEDEAWATRIAKHVKTESYIDKVMYEYIHDQTDSVWRGGSERENRKRPTFEYKNFRYHPDAKEEYNGSAS